MPPKKGSKKSEAKAPTADDQSAKERAEEKLEQGYAESTAAGEFIKEEMDHAKDGTHPVANRAQAVAIGLSKARKAGIGGKPKGRGEGPTGRTVSRKRSSAPGDESAPPNAKESTRQSARIRGKTDTEPGSQADDKANHAAERKQKKSAESSGSSSSSSSSSKRSKTK